MDTSQTADELPVEDETPVKPVDGWLLLVALRVFSAPFSNLYHNWSFYQRQLGEIQALFYSPFADGSLKLICYNAINGLYYLALVAQIFLFLKNKKSFLYLYSAQLLYVICRSIYLGDNYDFSFCASLICQSFFIGYVLFSKQCKARFTA